MNEFVAGKNTNPTLSKFSRIGAEFLHHASMRSKHIIHTKCVPFEAFLVSMYGVQHFPQLLLRRNYRFTIQQCAHIFLAQLIAFNG